MLTIETYIASSPINGLGLFTKNPIEQGTMIAYFEPEFDVLVSDIEKFFAIQQKFLKRNAFKLAEGYVLFSDDARYINHSKRNCLCYASPILIDKASRTAYRHCLIALVDIPSGSELTIDYEQVCPEQYAEICGFVERRNAGLWPPRIAANDKYNAR